MTLEVPLLSLSLVIVFFVSQSNVVLTRITGILFVAGITAAVAVSVLLLKLTYGYPLLRILGASVVFIASMFAMRATRLGPVFFLVAIVTIFIQSQVDLIAQPERLLRLCLWVWVAVVYPTLVMLLMNTLLLTQQPQRQLCDTLERQVSQIEARLNALVAGRVYEARILPGQVQNGMLSLHKLLKFSSMRDEVSKKSEAEWLVLITAVSRLYAAVASLSSIPDDFRTLTQVQAQCSKLAEMLHRHGGGALAGMQCPILECSSVDPALREICDALRMLRTRSDAASRPLTKVADPLFAADAFTNPNYLQFAVKTWIATCICYVFYSAVDWSGIHTSMLTCVIIALPSLGAAMQKGLLRLYGCLVGSVLAMASVVFIIPLIDNIIGLLLMSLPIIGLGAWVAAGSERISYAGVQIMFCFALALLDEFGPTTDLTEIRDRIIGVVIGLLVGTFIQAVLWPEREGDGVARRLSDALTAVVDRLRISTDHPSGADEKLQALNLRSSAQVAVCESSLARVALEPGWRQGDQEDLIIAAQTLLAQTREFHLLSDQFMRAYFARAEYTPQLMQDVLDRDRENMALWLEKYIACLRGSLEPSTILGDYPQLESNSHLDPLASRMGEMAALGRSLPML
ncbi:FUSC family protein [Pseudomonas sp. Pseu.R1]|uniref:FUSC family protein n=1 Tax=Pseudomonas sp. Pseu.R1 TaxID=3379818 RepID=UPI003B93CFEE